MKTSTDLLYYSYYTQVFILQVHSLPPQQKYLYKYSMRELHWLRKSTNMGFSRPKNYAKSVLISLIFKRNYFVFLISASTTSAIKFFVYKQISNIFSVQLKDCGHWKLQTIIP